MEEVLYCENCNSCLTWKEVDVVGNVGIDGFYDMKKVICKKCGSKEVYTTEYNLTNEGIWKWLEKQKYQTEYEETGEYKMYFDLDMPKILREFVKYYIDSD